MMKKRIFVFLLIIVGSSFICDAQITAYYKTQNLNNVYSISKETKKDFFFFPSYERFPSTDYAYRIIESRVLQLKKGKFDIDTSEVSLVTRYYAENISDIQFNIVGDGSRYEKIIKVHQDGYNRPVIEKIKIHSKDSLSKIKINYTVIDPEKESKLYFSRLEIDNNHIGEKVSPSDFFQSSPFDNKKYEDQFTVSPFDSYGELASFPQDEKEEDFKGVVYVGKQNEDVDSKQVLKEVFMRLLGNYPFYEVKKIDKDEFLLSSKAFLDNLMKPELCDVIKAINIYLSKTLKDPHFYIKSKCSRIKKRTPIYTYLLSKNHVIAAIFDEELKREIPLGSVLFRINGISVDTIDSSNVINNEMLKGETGEKMVLRIKTPGGQLKNIQYHIKNKYRIPKKIRPKNLSINRINDSTIYFKINKITYDLPQTYLNNSKFFNSSKKLILDLRGCSGGDFLASAQFLSYIIPNGFKYFDYESNVTGKTDPVIVRKSKISENYREDGEIALLVDNSTACVGELLIHAIKKNRNNVSIFGKDNHTKGALSFVYEINLFDEMSIVTNCLDTGRMILDGKLIEGKGINPDIFVVINSIKDLQPYEDKVLQQAVLN